MQTPRYYSLSFFSFLYYEKKVTKKEKNASNLNYLQEIIGGLFIFMKKKRE